MASNRLSERTTAVFSDERYNAVVVAGTFDRLHDGHRSLLAKAMAVTANCGTLVVGLTTEKLLRHKELSELIQSYDERRLAVQSFLESIKQSQNATDIFLEFAPISEPVPARGSTDGNLECIVVSKETRSGAIAMNEARQKNGVPELKVVVVELINTGKDKLSSTELRRRELGVLRKRLGRGRDERRFRSQLSPPPFVIGLTGGIASGKSTVREMLCKQQGAAGAVAAVDCDRLAHKAYLPGTPTYSKLLTLFGNGILAPDGTIHRPSLGTAVFANPDQMSALTGAVWPAVRQLVTEWLESLSGSAVTVAVVEAAMMVEAGSYRQVDELWVVGVPRQLAKERLMTRNGIGEEEAEKRMNSQMDSAERMRHADVVLYNDGPIADLEEQVAHAWALLQNRVEPLTARWQQVSMGQHPLYARWLGLTARLSTREDLAYKWWIRLCSEENYNASRRKCTGLERIMDLFHTYHEFAHFIEDPLAVQLAFVFHLLGDGHGSNESPFEPTAESVKSFGLFAVEADLDHNQVENVKQLLSFQEGESHGTDALWFHDFLFVAVGESKFVDSFCHEWNKELTLRGLKNPAAALEEIVATILSKSHIYLTHILRDKYETQARANLSRINLSLR